jgi:hypothetical protein
MALGNRDSELLLDLSLKVDAAPAHDARHVDIWPHLDQPLQLRPRRLRESHPTATGNPARESRLQSVGIRLRLGDRILGAAGDLP